MKCDVILLIHITTTLYIVHVVMRDILKMSLIYSLILLSYTVDIQAMNYYGALEKYNVMISSSNFSEVSSFLPGIKSLLQLGMQLRV